MALDYVSVSEDVSGETPWSKCAYCEDKSFKTVSDFTR